MRRALNFIALAILFTFSCGTQTPPSPESSNPPSINNTPTSPNPVTPPTVHFFSFGDWGTADANQIAVANQTQTTCLNWRCDFGLFLGDNFYSTGVTSVDDPQWQTKYRDIYGSLQIPLYAVIGNHDWDPPANPQAEVDFDLLDKDPYWRMPAFSYSFQYPQQGDPLVEIFVINSNNFASDTAAQSWLGQAVNNSQAPWKIVTFHHPVWDNGQGHLPDEKGIYPFLRPIICGKVDLMLSGHEHNVQHLQNTTDGCGYDQVIVGTGGKSLHDVNLAPLQTNWTLLFTEKNFGLGFFDLTSTQMTFHFLRTDGTESYSYSWQKP